MISRELFNHLTSINENISKRISCIINKLAKVKGINEDLKQTNQMQWVQSVNNIKNRAEEIVYKEIIYV